MATINCLVMKRELDVSVLELSWDYFAGHTFLTRNIYQATSSADVSLRSMDSMHILEVLRELIHAIFHICITDKVLPHSSHLCWLCKISENWLAHLLQ